MSDIFDYLEWRGDIPFTQVPVINADSAVFCCLSYIPYDGIVSRYFDEGIRLSEAIPSVLKLTGKGGDGRSFQMKEDEKFLGKIMDCPRYSELRICGFTNKFDMELEEQFCAMTFHIGEEALAVVFRGTDRTLIGWKEDFNLGYRANVPSHQDAVSYLKAAAEAFPNIPIYVYGHSKGGNLAMYASANCGAELQDRIVAVRNLDGPGFHAEEIESEGYRRIRDRIATYIPQSSVVGVLLEHAEECHVVHSHSPELMQHHVYTWDFRRGDFEMDDGVTDASQIIDSSVREWLGSMSPEDRGIMTDRLFDLINASGARTIDTLMDPKNLVVVMKALGNMDEDTHKLVEKTYKVFFDSVRKSMPFLKQAEHILNSAARDKAPEGGEAGTDSDTGEKDR